MLHNSSKFHLWSTHFIPILQMRTGMGPVQKSHCWEKQSRDLSQACLAPKPMQEFWLPSVFLFLVMCPKGCALNAEGTGGEGSEITFAYLPAHPPPPRGKGRLPWTKWKTTVWEKGQARLASLCSGSVLNRRKRLRGDRSQPALGQLSSKPHVWCPLSWLLAALFHAETSALSFPCYHHSKYQFLLNWLARHSS